jgi:hypothetical protein
VKKPEGSCVLCFIFFLVVLSFGSLWFLAIKMNAKTSNLDEDQDSHVVLGLILVNMKVSSSNDSFSSSRV